MGKKPHATLEYLRYQAANLDLIEEKAMQPIERLASLSKVQDSMIAGNVALLEKASGLTIQTKDRNGKVQVLTMAGVPLTDWEFPADLYWHLMAMTHLAGEMKKSQETN